MGKKIMMKKNFDKKSFFCAALFIVFALSGCDSFYDSAFEKLLGDSVLQEEPLKETIIEKRSLSSIYLKNEPLKKVYGIGDKLSLEGIEVSAVYTDGQEIDITKNVSYSGFQSSIEKADETITVSYSENGINATTTFTVSVFETYIKVQSLVFDEEYLNSVIGLGNSRKLQVTVLPEEANVKTVTWKSSDSSIASVTKDGIVTALKEGFVTITAISVDNPDITSECSVEAKYYHAEGVVINQPETPLRIEETKTAQLTAVVLPDLASQKVNWKSADTSIATVDNDGVITGVKSGSVHIIAMADDDETKTDSYTVEIFKYPVTSIQIKDKDGNDIPEAGITIFVEGSAKLTAFINEGATHKEYFWSSGAENIATVDSEGIVTGINGGSTTITATSVDNQEIVAVCPVTIDEITSLEPQNYQIGDVILKDGTFVSCNDVSSMTSEQKAKAVAVIYGYRTEVTEEGTESYALGVGLEHSNNVAWCITDSPGYSTNFTALYSSYDYDYVDVGNGDWQYVMKLTGNDDGSDDWECICSVDVDGTAEPATYYPAWNYVNNYGENKKLKGFYKNGWYLPSLKEIYKLQQSFESVNNIIQKISGTKLNKTSYYNYYLTSSTCNNSSENNYIWVLSYFDENIKGVDVRRKNETSETFALPVKAFPCSVAHYDETVQSKVSVTYPSYSPGNLALSTDHDNEGNYIFTIITDDFSELPENVIYRWILDNSILDVSYLSDGGTKLTLQANFLASLVSGNHVITVLQQTENGELFDACCYINITNGTENNFNPQKNPITVVLPAFEESTLTINSDYNSDNGSYTFTVVDSSRTYTKYIWFLDGNVLDVTGSVLMFNSSAIEELEMGAHLLTLLAQTDSGEYFDAQCYIRCYE